MPNYIRTQNPYIAAAESMDQIANPLARMFVQLPQVRAQMQQHADQMGIAQGRLNLEQQNSIFSNDLANRKYGLEREELNARIPLYGAQTSNYNAEAGLHNQQANQLMRLMELSKAAQAGKYQSAGGGYGMGGPTMEQANNNAFAQALGALAASSALDPTAAARALETEQKPLTLNANETAFGRDNRPFAQGMVNAPFGNTVLGGMQLGGGGQPSVIQQGQFRPPGSMQIDPSTGALNLGKLAELVDTVGAGGAADEQMINSLLQQAFQRAGGGALSNKSATVQSDRVKVQGPNGESGTMPKTSKLPQGWKIVQ